MTSAVFLYAYSISQQSRMIQAAVADSSVCSVSNISLSFPRCCGSCDCAISKGQIASDMYRRNRDP